MLGTEHSCAILNGGTLKTWGGNDYGEPGGGVVRSSLDFYT